MIVRTVIGRNPRSLTRRIEEQWWGSAAKWGSYFSKSGAPDNYCGGAVSSMAH